MKSVTVQRLDILLEDMRRGGTASRSPYPTGWTDAWIRRDLWERAASLARSGALPEAGVRLWGHWHGVCDGYTWSRAELRRRSGLGRVVAEGMVGGVGRAVAADLTARPPGEPRAGTETDGGDIEDGAALAHGRAVASEHRHRAEIGYAVRDLSGTGPTRRLPSGAPERKVNLKTSRHLRSAAVALQRAAVDSVARRLDGAPALGPATFPLWRSVDPETSDLEAALDRLRELGKAGERSRVARVLAEGHHHILHRTQDRELVCDFLFAESEVLGEHDNIARVAVLDALETLLPRRDPRRVDIARERVHVLEVHHYWTAASAWSRRTWERLSDPRLVWSHPDERTISAVRALERRVSLASAMVSAVPEAGAVDLSRMLHRSRELLGRVNDRERTREWRHIEDRRRMNVLWAVKNRDRILGLPTRWEDEELLPLSDIDAQADGLGIPVRPLGWGNQRLAILLAADRPVEFLDTARSLVDLLAAKGTIWPNQVAKARRTLVAATRRRSRAWRSVRDDVAALMAMLPDDTDDVLRHPLALPRPLVVNGVPV